MSRPNLSFLLLAMKYTKVAHGLQSCKVQRQVVLQNQLIQQLNNVSQTPFAIHSVSFILGSVFLHSSKKAVVFIPLTSGGRQLLPGTFSENSGNFFSEILNKPLLASHWSIQYHMPILEPITAARKWDYADECKPEHEPFSSNEEYISFPKSTWVSQLGWRGSLDNEEGNRGDSKRKGNRSWGDNHNIFYAFLAM